MVAGTGVPPLVVDGSDGPDFDPPSTHSRVTVTKHPSRVVISRASFCTVSQSFSTCGGLATTAEVGFAVVEVAEMAVVTGNLGAFSVEGSISLLRMLFAVLEVPEALTLVMMDPGPGPVVGIGLDREILGDPLDWWEFDWRIG